MRKRKRYPDDLTDQEWECIRDFEETRENKAGRKPVHERREVLNAIFYLLRTGCSWRHLPHEFPRWKSVYTQFRRWRLGGFFEKIHDHLRGELRVLLSRNKEPSAGIVDSQFVKQWGEQFFRMWEFYLASCEVAFRKRGFTVFQIQMMKNPELAPLTRDYITEAENQSRKKLF